MLVGAATSSGAAVGLVAAIVAGPIVAALPAVAAHPPLTIAAWAVAFGVGLDVVALGTGRLRPLTGGRQVPQEWTRLLSPTVVAALYGARLGVGPLTILSTWTWWSVTVAGALLGLGPSVAVGATFGLVRMATSTACSVAVAGTDDGARWFGRLRSAQRRGWLALNGLGLAVLLATTACSSTSRPEADGTDDADGGVVAAEARAGTDELEPRHDRGRVITDSDRSDPPSEPDNAADAADADEAAGDGGDDSATAPGSDERSADALITAVELEDVVRTPEETARSGTGSAGALALAGPSDPAPSPRPASLAAALIDEIDGFAPIDDPSADRYLDLRSASEIQPDPETELALLETRGFIGGWTRAFRSPANDVAVVSVYHFATAGEAEFYLEDGLIQIGGYGGTFFDIEGLPGVRGFAQTVPGDDGEELISLGAAFQIGPRWYLLYLLGSPETATPDVLVPAVAAQLDRAR